MLAGIVQPHSPYGGRFKKSFNFTVIFLLPSEETVGGINLPSTVTLTMWYSQQRSLPFPQNLQGDVIAIVDKNANTVARYSYDAWGVPTITEDISGIGIAEINPFRYRSYFYDEETGLYYLQSRYYDANVGRFVNGDESFFITILEKIIGNNLFTYCHNNSINEADYFGDKFIVAFFEE